MTDLVNKPTEADDKGEMKVIDEKWIEFFNDFFDDAKVVLIQSLPHGIEIVMIWLKMLHLACKLDKNGLLIVNDQIAYTPSTLAAVFRLPESLVSQAISTLEKRRMITIEDGIIAIKHWDEYKPDRSEEERRERHRLYMREYRERKRPRAAEGSNYKV